ncbi:hypothetical protein GGI20_002967 [Coemansia sp. BCRC 34301]|nr:hypothetical protein GGI20_002967 [Coemansia sp. BCRC 34301]
MSQQKKAPWDHNNKYWCNYCRIFVHDNKSTRNLHDSGAKHKDNVQKFLRQIQKDEEAKSKAEKKLVAQLKTIESAAAISYSKDIAAQGGATKTAVDTAVHPAAKSAGKNGGANAKALEPVSVVDSKPRRPDNVGVAGAWEVVEEEEEEEVREMPVQAQSLRGAEWLEQEENDTSDRPYEFDIKEKTVLSEAAEHGGGGEEAMALFKKRRVAANRSARKQRKL